jgi:hypothetical protein
MGDSTVSPVSMGTVVLPDSTVALQCTHIAAAASMGLVVVASMEEAAVVSTVVVASMVVDTGKIQ